MTPNPLLLRTGCQRRARASVVVARRRTHVRSRFAYAGSRHYRSSTQGFPPILGAPPAWERAGSGHPQGAPAHRGTGSSRLPGRIAACSPRTWQSVADRGQNCSRGPSASQCTGLGIRPDQGFRFNKGTVPSRKARIWANVCNCSSFISITMLRIMIDPS